MHPIEFLTFENQFNIKPPEAYAGLIEGKKKQKHKKFIFLANLSAKTPKTFFVNRVSTHFESQKETKKLRSWILEQGSHKGRLMR